jgi:tetratricopeptide (TPR) repeat protein
MTTWQTVRRHVLLAGLVLVSSAVSAQDPWAESYDREARGAYRAAIRALAPILAAQPDHELAMMRRGWLRYLNGQYNDAIRDYQRSIEINGLSLEARLGIMLPLLAQRRWREAAAYAQEVLRVDPWNYYAHVRLMIAEEGQRQWQQLASHAGDVARRYPSDATVRVYWARALARLGNDAEARARYEDVLERIPSHEEAATFVADHGD